MRASDEGVPLAVIVDKARSSLSATISTIPAPDDGAVIAVMDPFEVVTTVVELNASKGSPAVEHPLNDTSEATSEFAPPLTCTVDPEGSVAARRHQSESPIVLKVRSFCVHVDPLSSATVSAALERVATDSSRMSSANAPAGIVKAAEDARPVEVAVEVIAIAMRQASTKYDTER